MQVGMLRCSRISTGVGIHIILPSLDSGTEQPMYAAILAAMSLAALAVSVRTDSDFRSSCGSTSSEART